MPHICYFKGHMYVYILYISYITVKECISAYTILPLHSISLELILSRIKLVSFPL
jgi:hypothetical protein